MRRAGFDLARLFLYGQGSSGLPSIAIRKAPAETLANSCFTVSRWDRLLIFGGLQLAAIALFVVCFTLLPVLSLRPRKFAILYVLPLILRSVSSIPNSLPVHLGPVTVLCSIRRVGVLPRAIVESLKRLVHRHRGGCKSESLFALAAMSLILCVKPAGPYAMDTPA